MDADAGIVVVGGGAAANSFAHAYRDAGGVEQVTVVSDDERAPYFRPHLTKDLLAGRMDEDAIGLDDEWYLARNVDLQLRRRVDGIDLGTRTLATAEGPIAFGRLVVATGSSASQLPVPGADSPFVHRIRSLADTRRLLDTIADGGPVAIVGSGFIGCEVASSLRDRGHEVRMLSNEPAPQAERLGAAVGDLIAGWLRDHGIALDGGVDVTEIMATDGSAVVRTGDGRAVEAAHVVLATGAKPNTALLDPIGLADTSGVPVDASMRTPAADVFAVGDIAHAENVTAGRRLRVEHWGDAERMGEIAAHVIAGHDDRWAEVPGFWSAICGHELKYVAWGDGWDQVVERRSAEGVTFWYGREGRTVGVLTDNHNDDHERAPTVVAKGTAIPSR